MKKAIIIYESRYGNTKLVAERPAFVSAKGTPAQVSLRRVFFTLELRLKLHLESPTHSPPLYYPSSKVERFLLGPTQVPEKCPGYRRIYTSISHNCIMALKVDIPVP